MNKMTSYNLSMTSDQGSNLTLSSQMPEEIIRLLQLAGTDQRANLTITDVNAQPGTDVTTHISTDNPQNIMQVLAPEPPCDVVMEQQAEHDHGHVPDERGYKFDIKDYNFKGRADLPERLTSARYGSNPLKSEMDESNSYESLRALYEQFLEESQNTGGQASPLTSDNRLEFDRDPQRGHKVTDTGVHSPLSTILRQKLPK